MADEAVLVLRQEDPHDFIVSALVGIEKGTVLKMTNPKTAIASSASGDVPAGIARREHLANSDRTRLSVYRKGIFRMTYGGAITTGDQVVISGANLIRTALQDGSEDHIVLGRALEDGVDADVKEVAVNM